MPSVRRNWLWSEQNDPDRLCACAKWSRCQGWKRDMWSPPQSSCTNSLSLSALPIGFLPLSSLSSPLSSIPHPSNPSPYSSSKSSQQPRRLPSSHHPHHQSRSLHCRSWIVGIQVGWWSDDGRVCVVSPELWDVLKEARVLYRGFLGWLMMLFKLMRIKFMFWVFHESKE